MTTPLRPAPTDYDRSLRLTTMHWRAPSFGTVSTPDALALVRHLDAQGMDASHEIDDDCDEPRARDNEQTERELAWRADPACWVCDKATPAPERSAFLRTPDGPRVTCQSPCLAIGVARVNPYFRTSVALRRAQG